LIKTQLNFTPPQLAQIETLRTNIAKAIAIFENAIKGYRDIIEQNFG
jgi:hypothetical protein